MKIATKFLCRIPVQCATVAPTTVLRTRPIVKSATEISVIVRRTQAAINTADIVGPP